MLKNRFRHMAAIFVASSLILLSNASNPPTGLTGAPFDSGTCGNCHSGGGYSGSIAVNGLPATIQPNQVYNLDVTITGNAPFGGFQMVAVDGANANCGNLTASGQAGTEFLNLREYVEQRGRKSFSGGSVSWTFTWQAPPAATPPSGNEVKFYMCGNMVNGSGTGGDMAITAVETVPFAGSAVAVSATMANTTNVTCFGLANGTATVSAAGGTGAFSYQWSNGQTQQTAINLAPGTYTVTVTSGSATATATASITQPTVLNATATGATITCTNSVVNISTNPTGGTSPYSVAWSNGNSGTTTSVSAPGTYTATITDTNGCAKTAVANVTSNIVPPSANAGPAQQLGSNGTATLNGVGSSSGAQFSYLWTASAGGSIQSGGTTLQPIVNAGGTYTLQVTNSTNGCTATSSTTVTQSFTLPVAEAGPNFSITCATMPPYLLNGSGSSTGPEFSYQWTAQGGGGSILSGASTLTPTISGAGTYGLIVTNVLSSQTATDVVTVSQNTTVPGATATGGSITCNQPCIALSASSPTTGVTFSWSSGSSQVCQAGTYTVTITNPANSCTSTAQASVTENTTVPTASIAPNNSVLTCANSSIQLTASSNATGATFAWQIPGGGTSLGANLTANSPGTYTVTVTDPTNGCTATTQTTVSSNTTAPSVTISPSNPVLTCTNNSIPLTASSSTVGAIFAWVNGPTGANNTATTPGVYTVTATNPTNGCTATATTTVTANAALPTVLLNPSTTALTCSQTTSTINSTVSEPGGTYAWSNGSTNSSISVNNAGTFTLVYTTTNGCSASASVTITANNDIPQIAIAPSTMLTCANPTSLLVTTANQNGLSFSWSGPNSFTSTEQNPTVNAVGTYTVTGTNPTTGCSATQTIAVTQNTIAPSVTATGGTLLCNSTGVALTATGSTNGSYAWSGPNNYSSNSQNPTVGTTGTYTVTFTAAINGCTASATATVSADNNAPVLTLTQSNVLTCTNPSAQVCASSNVPGTLIGWTGPNNFTSTSACFTTTTPGNYTAVAVALNGCVTQSSINLMVDQTAPELSVTPIIVTCTNPNPNINTSATSSTLGATVTVALVNGQYIATATGLNGCTTSSVVPVSSDSSIPNVSVITSGQLTCIQTSVTITASSTTPGAVLSWTQQVVSVAGAYTVIVTNPANGCSAAGTALVASNTTPPNVSCSNASLSCNQTSVTLNATSSTPGVQLTWLNGNSPNPVTVSSPGTYTVMATDPTNGCTSTCSSSVSAGSLPVAQVVATSGCDGLYTVTVSVTGGTSPYTYAWSIPNPGPGLPPGIYTVTVTDASGCSVLETINLPTLPPPVSAVVVSVTNPTNGANGAINITVSNGVGPFTYVWRNESGQIVSNLEDPTGLPSGTYRVLITDANGCTTILNNIVLMTNGINEILESILRVYPVPATDILFIETDCQVLISHLTLTDLSGRKVLETTTHGCKSQLQLHQVPAGTYQLEVQGDEGQIARRRIVVQR